MQDNENVEEDTENTHWCIVTGDKFPNGKKLTPTPGGGRLGASLDAKVVKSRSRSPS